MKPLIVGGSLRKAHQYPRPLGFPLRELEEAAQEPWPGRSKDAGEQGGPSVSLQSGCRSYFAFH